MEISQIPLRIGVLIDRDTVEGWEAQLFRELKALGLAHVIVAVRMSDSRTQEQQNSGTSSLLFEAVRKLECLKLRRDPVFSEAMKTYSLNDLVTGELVVERNWSPSGLSWTLPEHEYERLASEDFDVLIGMSSGVARGRVLSASRHGILSWQHGDNRLFRGVPPGFWEVFGKSRTSGFTIKRLSDEPASGDVVARGTVTTQTYFVRNQYHLRTHSISRMLGVLERLSASGALPQAECSTPYSYPVRKSPKWHVTLRYCVAQGVRLAGKVARKFRSNDGVWGVGVCDGPWNTATLCEIHPLEPLAGTWIADPFVIDFQGRTLCFVEEYVQKIKRGRIAIFEIDGGSHRRLGVALEEDFHLSFPFVFESDEQLFMCPETSAVEEVRLYRCDGDLLEWKLHSVPLTTRKAVDSVVTRSNGKWTLLTNLDETGASDFGCGVWAFQSDSLDENDWLPVGASPIWSDGEALRNGGLIREEGRDFRVGQFSDFAAYGTGFVIEEISLDDPSHPFRRQVACVFPEFKAGISGTHHMSSTGLVTAIDYFRT